LDDEDEESKSAEQNEDKVGAKGNPKKRKKARLSSPEEE
jgi:hypothetical protein